MELSEDEDQPAEVEEEEAEVVDEEGEEERNILEPQVILSFLREKSLN